MSRLRDMILATMTVTIVMGLDVPSAAIERHPTNTDVNHAIDRGKEAAQAHRQLDLFRVTFGSLDAGQPGGFLLTKLGSLSVMAAHMALRGVEPSQSDITQVLDAPTMLVSTFIFGDTPSFAVDSYMVLEQGAKTVKPATIRVDGRADRSAVWPSSPRFKAKMVGAFNYADFDPMANSVIIIFPAGGGEIRFALNFSEIK